MIEEFAIDLECFADRDIFHILRECGFSKGRVICEFPRKNWGANIRDTLRTKNISDIEQSKIVALLQRLKNQDRAIVRRSSASFDSDLSWISNACIEHDRYPFKAILSTSNLKSNASVVELGKAWDEGSPWSVETSMPVKMSTSEFAKRTHPLLRHSETVRFIDPYIDPGSSEALNKINFTLESAAKLRSIKETLKVEIHFLFSDRSINTDIDKYNTYMDNIFGGLQKAISFPSGTNVLLVAWPKFITKELKLHNRHVITERGGITFGSSFNETLIDQAKLMSEAEHALFWQSFNVPDNVPCEGSAALRKYRFEVGTASDDDLVKVRLHKSSKASIT